MASSSSCRSAKPTANPNHQPRGVLRCRTIWLIWAVRLPKVWPGAISRSCSDWCVVSTGGLAMLRFRHLGIRVLERRQVGGPGTRLELGQKAVVPRLGLALGDFALRVVH